MNDDYRKLFNKLEQFEPSEKLFNDTLARIDFEKRRSVGFRLMFLGVATTASLAVMILSFQYVAREFYQSGFYQYFSLIFSDGAVIMTSWKEFVLSLAETAPIMKIIIFLSAVFAFLVSSKLAIKNFIQIDYKLS